MARVSAPLSRVWQVHTTLILLSQICSNMRQMRHQLVQSKKASLSSSTGAILCATSGTCTKGRMDRFFRTARTRAGGGGTATAPALARYLDNLWGKEPRPRYGSALVYEPPGSSTHMLSGPHWLKGAFGMLDKKKSCWPSTIFVLGLNALFGPILRDFVGSEY